LDDSAAVIIDILAVSWQWGRKGSFKITGWNIVTVASVEHRGKFSHHLINILVILAWILVMEVFLH
jgi:hypothetical protein